MTKHRTDANNIAETSRIVISDFAKMTRNAGQFIDEVDLLVSEIEQLRKERDTAFKFLQSFQICSACRSYNLSAEEDACMKCRPGDRSQWEWRGLDDGEGR